MTTAKYTHVFNGTNESEVTPSQPISDAKDNPSLPYLSIPNPELLFNVIIFTPPDG